jgi:hypothetical protein
MMATSNGEIIKSRIVLTICILIAPFFSALSASSASATQTSCRPFNFAKLFYADYSTGSHWDNSSGDLVITWTSAELTIGDEKVTSQFTPEQVVSIRRAFASWDSVLKTVAFQEVNANQGAQIAIGFVDLAPSQVQPTAVGFWSAWVKNKYRDRATIKLKSSRIDWFSNQTKMMHTVQHELGNVLGLGDITPKSKFTSVLEDPWQPPYGREKLSDFDTSLIRQLYGERTCPKQAKATSPRSQGKVASLA